MFNFVELLNEKLEERDKSIQDLEENGILAKNTFYIFKHSSPSLITMIKIANFLKMSIDYILDRVTDNKFKKLLINII